MIDGVATKNAAPVVCSPYLSVSVRVDDEVTGSRKFALVSGICHSGTLTSGHYSAFVRDNVCGVWLHYYYTTAHPQLQVVEPSDP